MKYQLFILLNKHILCLSNEVPTVYFVEQTYIVFVNEVPTVYFVEQTYIVFVNEVLTVYFVEQTYIVFVNEVPRTNLLCLSICFC